jgi:WD40 repeat protein
LEHNMKRRYALKWSMLSGALWAIGLGESWSWAKAGKQPHLGSAFEPEVRGEGAQKAPRILSVDDESREIRIPAVAFSRDGSRIAASAVDRRFKVGFDIGSFLEGDTPIRITTSGPLPVVAIWDAVTGSLIRTIGGFEAAASCVAFSPDGSRLAAGGVTGFKAIAEGDRSGRSFMGRVSIIERGGGLLRVWDLATGRATLKLEGHEAPIDGVGWGTFLVSHDRFHVLHVWRDDNGASFMVMNQLKGDGFWVRGETALCTAFSADGTRAVAISTANRHLNSSFSSGDILYQWDITKNQVQKLTADKRDVRCVAMSDDGMRIAAGGCTHRAGRPSLIVTIWDFAKFRMIRELTFPIEYGPHLIAMNPDGSRVACGIDDGKLLVWDATTGRLLRTFEDFEGPTRAVAFLPTGLRFVTGGTRYLFVQQKAHGIPPTRIAPLKVQDIDLN